MNTESFVIVTIVASSIRRPRENTSYSTHLSHSKSLSYLFKPKLWTKWTNCPNPTQNKANRPAGPAKKRDPTCFFPPRLPSNPPTPFFPLSSSPHFTSTLSSNLLFKPRTRISGRNQPSMAPGSFNSEQVSKTTAHSSSRCT